VHTASECHWGVLSTPDRCSIYLGTCPHPNLQQKARMAHTTTSCHHVASAATKQSAGCKATATSKLPAVTQPHRTHACCIQQAHTQGMFEDAHAHTCTLSDVSCNSRPLQQQDRWTTQSRLSCCSRTPPTPQAAGTPTPAAADALPPQSEKHNATA
jgi:hypothetical protein